MFPELLEGGRQLLEPRKPHVFGDGKRNALGGLSIWAETVWCACGRGIAGAEPSQGLIRTILLFATEDVEYKFYSAGQTQFFINPKQVIANRVFAQPEPPRNISIR